MIGLLRDEWDPRVQWDKLLGSIATVTLFKALHHLQK